MEDAAPASAPWPHNSGSGRSPFGSLSSSLGKRLGGSADNLRAMAAEAERKIKTEGERIKTEWQHTSSKLQASIHRNLHLPAGFDDWPRSLDGGKGDPDAQVRERRRSRLRRVRTFGEFRRGSPVQTAHEHDEGKGWDLAVAVNNVLSRRPVTGPGTPLVLPPAPLPSLRDQQVNSLTGRLGDPTHACILSSDYALAFQLC